MVEEYLTTRQVAYLLNFSQPFVEALAAEGILESFETDSILLFKTSTIAKYVTKEIARYKGVEDFLEGNDGILLSFHEMISLFDTTYFYLKSALNKKILEPKFTRGYKTLTKYFFGKEEVRKYYNYRMTKYEKIFKFLLFETSDETLDFWEENLPVWQKKNRKTFAYDYRQ